MKNSTLAHGMVKVVVLGEEAAGKTNILYRMT
jgi:hypothetical protein